MDKTREKVIKKINEKMQDVIKSKNIEKSAFNKSIDCSDIYEVTPSWDSPRFKHIYFCNVNSVLSKLDSEDILKALKSKEISPCDLATLPHDSDISSTSVFEEEISDGVFTCFKCNSKKTSFYSLQTRSADEPMTNFITCLICKHRWKM